MAIAARNADYQLLWKNKAPAVHGLLQSLADKVVSRVHSSSGINANALGAPLNDPITIATVIDADGQEKSDPDVLGETLTALLALRQDWKTLKLQPPATAADSEVPQLLANGRGRSVWNPRHFSSVEEKGRRTANGCYHRNLTLATMQTAGLTALIGRADEVLSDPKGQLLALSPKEVSKAINILNNLSAGEFTTYRSWSLKHQISFAADRMKIVAAKLGN